MTFLVDSFFFPTSATVAGVDAAQAPAQPFALNTVLSGQGWINSTGGLSIPPGVTLIRPTVGIGTSTAAAGLRVDSEVAGASYIGKVSATGKGFGDGAAIGVGALRPVIAEQVVSFDVYSSSGNVGGNANRPTFFGLESVDPSVRYALAHKTGNQAISSNTLTAVQFDSEVVDSIGFHDNATNNTRMTIPSGTTGLFRVTANIVSGTQVTAGNFGIYIYKNGAAIFDGISIKTDFGRNTGVGAQRLNICSPILEATAGDYFEIYVRSGGVANTILNDDGTWFQIEEVAATARALYTLTSDQSLPSATETRVLVDTQVYDNSTFYNATDDNYVVPADVSHIRVSGHVSVGSSNSSDLLVYVKKNNQIIAISDQYSTVATWGTVNSPVIPVREGDTIGLFVFASVTTGGIESESWLAIEQVGVKNLSRDAALLLEDDSSLLLLEDESSLLLLG